MGWDDLRYVLAVSQAGSLAGAGRALGVDATTVGRRLLAIESDLGARLFDRTADGFVPTHAGGIAIERAAEMQRQALALEREVAGSDARVEGPVRLTGLDLMIDFLIPHVPRLLERHPGLELTLASTFAVLDLSRREADIALRHAKPRHPDLVGRKVGSVATGLYVARRLEVGATPPLIGFPRDLDPSAFAQIVGQHFPEGRIVARANTEWHAWALARAGVGITTVDCFAGDRDRRLRRALPEPIATSTLWATVHVDMHRAPRVRAVIDFVGEVLAAHADLLEGRRPGAA